jgi:DNA-binding transcriptional ArsR family regulator
VYKAESGEAEHHLEKLKEAGVEESGRKEAEWIAMSMRYRIPTGE